METDKIYCGDCVNILNDFIDNQSIDLTVTSPPYDDLRKYHLDGELIFDHKPIIRELYRVTKKGGVVVWVVGDATIKGSETGTSFEQALFFKDIGFSIHDTMIYQKTGFSFPSSNRYHQLFEYMFVFAKGKPKTFNPICDERKLWGGSWGKTRVRDKDGGLIRRNIENEGMAGERGGDYGFKMRSNIWKIANGKGFGQRDEIAYDHPATFPEQLAKDHILSWSNEGDIILDPMCGSGTTCKIASILKRYYIGIDISDEYCKIAELRLQQQHIK
jgi:DNA modification methylase